MIKPTAQPAPTMVFCGVDVSRATLAVAVQHQDPLFQQHEFANSARGHQELIAWLGKRGAPVRVSLEATGIYSLDLALALDAAPGIEVAVLNPKAVHRFAQTLRRSKTDPADAQALAEYSRRMPFVPWRAPSRAGLQLRSISRHIDGLTVEHTRESNRLHAAQGSAATPRPVVRDLKRSLASLERRLVRLRHEAMLLVQADATLRQRFQLLTSRPDQRPATAGRTGSPLARDVGAPVGRPQRTRPSPSNLRHLGASTLPHQPRRQSPSAQGSLYARSGGSPARPPPESLLPTPPKPPQSQAPGPPRRRKKAAPRHLRYLQNKNTLQRRKTLPRSTPSFLEKYLLFKRESEPA
jgi:transposase